jgi:hypothetical protein
MKNNGGPAFPTGTAYHGMTLRDYFAAKVMQSFALGAYDDDKQLFEKYAERSYEIADEMLKQSQKPPQREWVGLTEIEICDLEADELTSASSETFSFARAIEAKLKEKNT